MKTSEISFLSKAEQLTLIAYDLPRKRSILLSEIISRLAAFILLSPAAAIDFVFHTLLLSSTFCICIGNSYKGKTDFTLPWQHIQRIRNVVTPLLLGSMLGILHPLAGINISEPTDKHAFLGIISDIQSYKYKSEYPSYYFVTPCSPVHSLSILENIAKKHRHLKDEMNKELFPQLYIDIIKDLKKFEHSLELLTAQEYIHKIMNITFYAMSEINKSIYSSSLSNRNKEILIRISGLLIPILTSLDTTIIVLAQIFFLATGAIRLISDRGPIYTEVTSSPLMHISFLIQNILKTLGTLIGTCIWFYSPKTAFRISLELIYRFFKLQTDALLSKINLKLDEAIDGSQFMIPILYQEGACSAFSIPTHSMHKTYLIVKKEGQTFNLYWVNRPDVSYKMGLDKQETLAQVKCMLDERFPFMNKKQLSSYPVYSKKPDFLDSTTFTTLAPQGNTNNCVVSNMCGALEVLDKIRNEEEAITELRYKVILESLIKDYGFYKNDFFPFYKGLDGNSLNKLWSNLEITS